MHQQALGTHGVAVEDVALFIRADVQPAREYLAVLYRAERVLEVDGTGADAFDLGAEELYASFVALEHEVVVERLAVLRYLLYALGTSQNAIPPKMNSLKYNIPSAKNKPVQDYICVSAFCGWDWQ